MQDNRFSCAPGVGKGRSQEIDGIVVLDKKVILYGGECNANVFRSNGGFENFCAYPEPCQKDVNVPMAVVDVYVTAIGKSLGACVH